MLCLADEHTISMSFVAVRPAQLVRLRVSKYRRASARVSAFFAQLDMCVRGVCVGGRGNGDDEQIDTICVLLLLPGLLKRVTRSTRSVRARHAGSQHLVDLIPLALVLGVVVQVVILPPPAQLCNRSCLIRIHLPIL